MSEMINQLQTIVDELHEKLEHPDLAIETKKIQQKLREASYNEGDIQPLADCVLALLLAAKSRGCSVETLFDEVNRVAADIKSRDWKKMPNGTYQAM